MGGLRERVRFVLHFFVFAANRLIFLRGRGGGGIPAFEGDEGEEAIEVEAEVAGVEGLVAGGLGGGGVGPSAGDEGLGVGDAGGGRV